MAHIRRPPRQALTPPPTERDRKRERKSANKNRSGTTGAKNGRAGSVPRRPHQERAAQTVEAILDGASELLVERGYASASTNAIAKRAGVSIGSLYQYFRDKDDVFRGVVRRHRQEVVPLIHAALDRMREPNADLVELTLGLLHQMARVNGKNPRLLAAIDDKLGWLEHEDDEELDLQGAVAAILRVRHPEHRFPTEVTATLIVTLVSPLSRWIVHSKPPSLDAEQLIRAFGCMLSGLLAVPAAAVPCPGPPGRP